MMRYALERESYRGSTAAISIELPKEEMSVSELCREFGVSRPTRRRTTCVNHRWPADTAYLEGGRITNQHRLALAQRDEADLTYRQTVQQAFADVSNSLVGYRQARLYRMKLQEQTATYKETSRLENVRFTGGATSFLEVLTTQQQYFTAKLQNYVQLYQALGGGW
jgi:Outer membrane efflux protein